MTQEDFVNKYEHDMRSILLAGYFCDETDYAKRYRKMNVEMVLLRERLRKMHHDLFPAEVIKPKESNEAKTTGGERRSETTSGPRPGTSGNGTNGQNNVRANTTPSVASPGVAPKPV